MSKKQSRSITIGGRRLQPAALLALIVVVGAVWLLQRYGGGTATPNPTPRATSTAVADAPAPTVPPITPAATPVATDAPFDDGLETVRLEELPSEALDVLELIGQGGPFPYSQDGGVFQNREGLLPKQASGYYHEYTVETPGSSDRGARRIVTGSAGEIYYTDDHYASFRRVIV